MKIKILRANNRSTKLYCKMEHGKIELWLLERGAWYKDKRYYQALGGFYDLYELDKALKLAGLRNIFPEKLKCPLEIEL